MEISVQNLNMTYPNGNKALQDINIVMKSPNLIGLIGPNGAGKSTFMKLLVAGLLPTNGSILVDGKPILKNEKVLKANLGYLPQSFGLYDELTVWQFLDYMAALKGIPKSKTAIDRAIEETNLSEKRRARIRTLSGGQRQRVGIAQALLGNPGLLIFGEPTVGLDPEERINFRNLFSQAAQDKIVLLSTHIIEDVQSVCNRLLVINHGKILFNGTPGQLIISAHNHVGVFERQAGENAEEKYHVTARVNTARGIACRILAQKLPDFAQVVDDVMKSAIDYGTAHYGKLSYVSGDRPVKIIQASAFHFGGRAGDNFSVMGETFFSDKVLNNKSEGASSAEVLAHEIIHQWWNSQCMDPQNTGWTQEGVTVYTTYQMMKEKYRSDYAQKNYIDVWEKALKDQSRSFYNRHPEYLNILPKKYAADIRGGNISTDMYDAMPLKIYKAAKLVGGEDKMDKILAGLYQTCNTKMPPYITYNDFLKACNLSGEALKLD